MENTSLSHGLASLEKVADHVFPRQSPRRSSSSSAISPGPTDTQPDGMAVPDSGSGPFGIRCPSTHPLVASLHGPTASLHLGLGTVREGRFLGCLGSSRSVPYAENTLEIPMPNTGSDHDRTSHEALAQAHL